MKKSFLWIALFAMSVMLTSCSKDDDVDLGQFDYPINELFGTWKASIIWVGSRYITVSHYPQYAMQITFNSDGTFRGSGYLGDGSGTYKVSGKTITTYVDGGVYATYYVTKYEQGAADFTITIGKESIRMWAYNADYDGDRSATAITPPSTMNN